MAIFQTFRDITPAPPSGGGGGGGTGTFTPAAGVTAALYGNTLSSAPVTGLSNGALLTINLASGGLGAPGTNTSLFYAELQSDLSTENVVNGRSYDLSRVTQTLTGPNGITAAFGGPAIQTTTNPTNAAGALMCHPNATANATYRVQQGTNFTQTLTGTATQAYCFFKSYVDFYPQNMKALRGWQNSVGGATNGDVLTAYNIFNGYPMGTENVDEGYYASGSHFLLNQWNTQEYAFKEGTSGTSNGVWTWFRNGFINAAGGRPFITQNATYGPANSRIFYIDEFTVNNLSNSAWISTHTYAADVGISVGSDPATGFAYQYYTMTGGVSGSDSTVFNGAVTVTDGTITWYNESLPSNSSGVTAQSWGCQCLLFDDQPNQIVSTPETSFNTTATIGANNSNYNQREIQPRYNCVDTQWTVAARRGSHPTGTTETVYSVNYVTNASIKLGTYTW